MYEFRRKTLTHTILKVLPILLLILVFLGMAFWKFSNIACVWIIAIAFVCFIISRIYHHLVPTFCYSVTLTDNELVFHFSENDHRPISRHFKARIKKNEIVLSHVASDTVICIAYNNEVKNFLKSVQK